MNLEHFSLADVTLLLDIAKAKSIRKIALQRNVAQPALSRRVHNLEESLGSAVFSRNRRGVETTAFGKIALDHLSRWRLEGLAAAKQIEANLNTQRIIKLGTYDSVAIYFFPRLLKLVKAAGLNCNLELHLGRSHEVLKNISDGKLELGLVFCGGKQPMDLKITTLAKDEYGFFESCVPRSSDDFYTLSTSTDEAGNSIASLLRAEGLEEHRLVHAPSFEVAASLTLAGLGIGVLPLRVAEAYVKQKKLRPLKLGKLQPFGEHRLSLVRPLHNRDQTLDRLVSIIRGAFS